jgi:hypothetical protein
MGCFGVGPIARVAVKLSNEWYVCSQALELSVPLVDLRCVGLIGERDLFM